MAKKIISVQLEAVVYKVDNYNERTKLLIKIHSASKEDPSDEVVFANIWIGKETEVQSEHINKYDTVWVDGALTMKKSKGLWFVNVSAYTIKVVRTKEEADEYFARKKEENYKQTEAEEIINSAGSDGIPF